MTKNYPVNQVKILLTTEQIHARIEEITNILVDEYQGKNVLLVGVLKGSLMILADLTRSLWQHGLTDCEIDFMGISSYGHDTESSKNPRITKDLDTNIQNRHVLIVEDIVDTGYSLDALLRMLAERHPASLKTFVLLNKQSRREVNVPVEYTGFDVDGWVEGYGLDTEELFRGRPEIVVRQA
jgi:hypoxanthine phosphoribosyltransferase